MEPQSYVDRSDHRQHLGRQRATTDLLRDLAKRVPTADLLREKGAPIWLRDRIKELDADPRAA